MPAPTRILAISPGARLTGVVALDAIGGLAWFETLRLRGISAPETRGKRVEDAIFHAFERTQPSVVVIEELARGRNTAANRAIASAAELTVMKCGLPCQEWSLASARRVVSADRRMPRASLHRLLVEHYPQLAPHVPSLSQLQGGTELDQYWERSFAALTIAVAELARRQQSAS